MVHSLSLRPWVAALHWELEVLLVLQLRGRGAVVRFSQLGGKN